jgi:hypothetical protein
VHGQVVDLKLLADPVQHGQGRVTGCCQDVVHQLRIVVIAQAGVFLAHQLPGQVEAARHRREDHRTFLLGFFGFCPLVPVDPVLPEGVQA